MPEYLPALVYLLSGAFTIISILCGVLWSMTREEQRIVSEELKKKADNVRIHDLEIRWKEDLTQAREGSEKLINKLEERHVREIDALAGRLADQIKNTEVAILAQIRLMVDVMKVSKDWQDKN